MQKTFLFVYGTLKRAGSNHSMMNNSPFVGVAKLAPGTTLYTNGHYPMMVECKEIAGDTGVEGEIFEVDARTLARLDSFEGHPRLFKRSIVDVSEFVQGVPSDLSEPIYAYVFQQPITNYRHLGVKFDETQAPARGGSSN